MADPAPTENPRTRSELKAEIVQHLLAGATLTHVATLPGMAPMQRIQYWRRVDTAFDQAVGEALRRGRHRHAAFDEALGRAVILRYATGEPLKSIAADPAMPSFERIAYWRMTEGQFGADIIRLKASAADTRRQVIRQRPPPWPYDQAVADQILVRIVRGEPLRAIIGGDPALPSHEAIKRWRREQPVFDAELAIAWRTGTVRRHRVQRRQAYAEKLVGRIVLGATLTSIGRQADMPCADTLRRWLRQDPEFARRIHEACDIRRQRLVDRMFEVADRVGFASMPALRRILAPLSRQETRLRNWPARRHRRR